MKISKIASLAITALCVLFGILSFACASAFAVHIYYPSTSFGAPGSGPGQFNEPIGVAVNDGTGAEAGAGDVYVADKGNDRVERFSAGGTYLGQFDGSGTFEVEGSKVEHGTAAPTGVLSAPEQVAVDNCATALGMRCTKLEDPSVGDVYVTDSGHKVVDKFSPVGEYLGQITEGSEFVNTAKAYGGVCPSGGCEVHTFASLGGLAVAPNGDLWVDNVVEVVLEGEAEHGKVYDHAIAEQFNGADGFEESFELADQLTGKAGMAFEPDGEIDAVVFGGRVEKFAATPGHKSTSEGVGGGSTGLAVVPSVSATFGGGVFVDTGNGIARYAPITASEQQPLEVFPGEDVPQSLAGLSESYGVAVSAEATVYATQLTADKVQSFVYVNVPAVTTQPPSGVTETEIRLNGTIGPEGEELTKCFFEYGTEPGLYTGSVPCKPRAGAIGETETAAVSAGLGELEPANVRTYRLVGVDADGFVVYGKPVTVSRPLVTGEAVSNVGLATAVVSAQIAEGGLAPQGCEPGTIWWIEYGASEAYGEKTAAQCVGAGEEALSVQTELASGLAPGATYHYRFVAKNALGTRYGADATFTTFGSSEPELPDGRVNEVVSSLAPGHQSDVYVPTGMLQLLDSTASVARHGIASERPFAVSASGEAVAYAGEPPVNGGNGSEGNGNGNQYIATRSPSGGWTQLDLNAPVLSNTYLAFSGDLSLGALASGESLAQGAPEGYSQVYRRTTSAGDPFEASFTATPSCVGYVSNGNVQAEEVGFGGGNAGTAAAPAFSHLLFEASGELPSTPAAEAGCAENYLYDASGGKLYLVNVLPEGKGVAPHAMFGRQGLSKNGFRTPEIDHAISADGSRIFWSAQETVPADGEFEERPTALYVRENDTSPSARTVLIAEGDAEFQTASSDGSLVFYTKEGSLYSFDLEAEQTTDLSTPVDPAEQPDVQGVMGTSEDGSYVYFVAEGVLGEGKNAEEREPAPGQPNLYLYHDGDVRFIATLSPEDNVFEDRGPSGMGDWRADAGKRTAEVTADGQNVVFMSRMPLTGYDNLLEGVPLTEVFVYDAQTQRVLCASCNPSGEAPIAPAAREYTEAPNDLQEIWGSFLPVSTSLAGQQPRLISENGSRVFFDSIEPLAPRDGNGYLDVYEWEASGEGSCREAGGCIYLLSGGQDPENSYLVGASASGNDVFFVSRAQLVAADRGNEEDVLYDARIGGQVPPAQESCSGTGCQGIAPSPPIFATPASVTFNGIGNFAPPSGAATSKRPAGHCPAGKRRRHGRCVKSKKARRRHGKGARSGKSARSGRRGR
jgi:hypothetical protein